MQELTVILSVAREAASQSEITEEAAIFRFGKLVKRATDKIEDANKLIRVRLTKDPENLESDSAKVQVRKFRFLKDERKLHSMSERL